MIRKPVFILILLAALVLSGCQLNKGDKDSDPVIFSYAAVSQRIMDQIDRNLDDYLMYEPLRPLADLIRLETIMYGSFTSPNASECVAIFKCTDAPHAVGLDRTLVVVCTADNLKWISQYSYGADQVSLALLDGSDHQQCFLFIGSSTFQGITATDIQVLQIQEGEWIVINVFEENPQADAVYSYSDGALHIFHPLYENGDIQYQYINTLRWDPAEKVFTGISG